MIAQHLANTGRGPSSLETSSIRLPTLLGRSSTSSEPRSFPTRCGLSRVWALKLRNSSKQVATLCGQGSASLPRRHSGPFVTSRERTLLRGCRGSSVAAQHVHRASGTHQPTLSEPPQLLESTLVHSSCADRRARPRVFAREFNAENLANKTWTGNRGS